MSQSTPRNVVAADAYVHLVADQLIAGLRDDDLPPVLVHVTDEGVDRLEVGVTPLDRHHPSDLLVGFTAPQHWHAIGVAAHGWAYRTQDRHQTHDRLRAPQPARVSVVTLVTRTGEVAHRSHAHHDLGLAAALASDEIPTGEQHDLLRRALGLETPPPPCGADVYWTIEWLASLLDESAPLTTWDEVAARHPAVVLLRRSAPDPHLDAVGDDFVDIVRAFTNVVTWSRLRGLVETDRFTVPELAPVDAAWFDDGAFSRFVLSRCPPLNLLRDQVHDHLPPAVGPRLVQVLDDLDVPASSWPDDAGRAA